MISELIKAQIRESIDAKLLILENKKIIDNIESVAKIIIECYKNGNKVLICGNGGSAADSQHLVGEFVSKFRFHRKSLGAISLNTNTSILTSIGNDYEYDYIFERQIEGLGNKGDVLIGISTTGSSNNISRAFKKAKSMGITTIGFLGKDGGENNIHTHISVIVPSNDTPRIQESHIMIGHIICDIVEQEICGESNNE